MFSSFASFFFGSPTNCETNSETPVTETAIATGERNQADTLAKLIDENHLTEVTSLTPSVTGAGDKSSLATKRGKNKHNNQRQQNKRKGGLTAPLKPKQTNHLNLRETSEEDELELDEDEWFIVEKEGEKEDLATAGSDSEQENVPVSVEGAAATKAATAAVAVAVCNQPQPQRQQHINSHSLCSVPRPQKRRNFLQKGRNNRPNNSISVSTLCPARKVNDGRIVSGHGATADNSVTHSMFVTSSEHSDDQLAIASKGLEAINKMEESWFITPPPCFTSVGPIEMETSPYENLLIEHPSMSVYHSIKSAQENTESFTKLDLEITEDASEKSYEESLNKKNSQAVQPRSSGVGYRLDRQSVALLKQELLARNVQKVQNKKERRDMCRSAIQRANKVRDVQSRNHTKRRSDHQHSKVFSNANNNRKSNCC